MAEDSCAAYKAAGVIFFTQENGRVRDVLLALEERKVSAKLLGVEPKAGTESTGKVSADVVVFPQGRREKKDEGDPVETAMREYHEETGNFGALTEHLLRFYGDEALAAQAGPGRSFLMYFGLARMVVVFCEVPLDAYERSLRPLTRADLRPKAEDAEPTRKRQRASTYKVGRENHLTPVWVSAEALGRAVTAKDAPGPRSVSIEVTVCPRPGIDGTGRLGVSGHEASEGVRSSVPFFALNLSVLRQREARAWLGLPAPVAPVGAEAEAVAQAGQ